VGIEPTCTGLQPVAWPSGSSVVLKLVPRPYSTPTWIRTRTETLGGSCAVLYTIGTSEPTTGFAPASSGLQDRRLAMSSHVGNRVTEEGLSFCFTGTGVPAAFTPAPYLSSSTRIRTRNISLEARHDFHFTIEPTVECG
jgi:hypothetical protein